MPLFVCESPLTHVHCPDSLTAEGWRNLPGVGAVDAMGIARYVEHHGGSVDVFMQCQVLDSIQWCASFPIWVARERTNP